MRAADGDRSISRRPGLRWAAGGAALAVVVVLVWRLFAMHGDGTAVDLNGVSHVTPGDGVPGIVALTVVVALVGWLVLRLQARSEQARRAGAQWQALCDVLDVWQWRTDAQHRVVQARPPSEASTPEWSLPAVPQPLWQHFRPDNAAALEARMRAGASLHDVEARREAADGSTHRGRLRGRALVDAAGRFDGYLGTWREEPAAPAAGIPEPPSAFGSEPGALDAAGSERESFSYTVSHDLRAPIRVVEGFTKIVKEDYGNVLDRVGHDHLDRVLGAAARMNGMIDALLALSRLSAQPIARQPVNLSQLAGFVADDLRRLWPDRMVELEVAPDLQVLGDPTLLRVVLENLLGNAWKYTAQRKPARIRFERSSNDPPTYTVSDNGAGFDMRFADRLFGVFQRLHSASEFPGTGIGLASVRRIVRRHGGEIWAEAEPDRGARFHFTLPQPR
ncbi:MAG TPA: ATP-binding protein [Caldimonas sp.]|nr:ATP-binding protein [Caldimonas sp.]